MRYKIVACILLILSVFSFVLAAPVPVGEVREACADAVEGDENVIIVSGKRAPRGNPYDREGSDSDSDTEWWTPPPKSSPAVGHASGSHPGVDMPSSSSGGSESPLLTPGGTEVPLDPEGASKPGTTTENQPVSSSEAKSVSWGHTNKVLFFHDEPDGLGLPPPHPDVGMLSSPTTTEDQPASSSGAKSVSWGHTTKVHFFHDGPDDLRLPPPPGRQGYLVKVAGQQTPSLEIESASPSSYLDPPPPPKPQSKGFVNNFKTFFGKLGKLNFRPRFQRTVDTGG
jgi:hypothetical protein